MAGTVVSPDYRPAKFGLTEPADELAGTAFIPDEQWDARDVKGTYTGIADILDFARRMEINPAIVAGRWQKAHRDYRKFSKLLGHGTVRPCLEDLLPSAI